MPSKEILKFENLNIDVKANFFFLKKKLSFSLQIRILRRILALHICFYRFPSSGKSKTRFDETP